ncbi:tyrosine phosphatase family-domain-containing protein [Dactylonectria estremocensis]|uniref:diphosphoinositol-polyphosphate diphosphatase n=1 Tax=Dactylonectria estremocensis TaxID=1079267 RepID=A0A9P9IW20_9HYPO|nr:tyrosine phosphatase family-domain-containing protein [Dactylonectria estremocensis]
MASKRNSRAYVDEAAHREEGESKHTNPPSRSRRSSRSSSKEDAMLVSKEADEGQRNLIPPSDATSMVRSQSASTIGSSETLTKAHESTAMSASSSASSFSSQGSKHPPAPLNGRPINFGIVIPGVYRSSYPKPSDFEYIKSLKLKTVVTLVKKDDRDQELESFLSDQGIHQVVINMKGTKKEAIPLNTMKDILSIVLNKENYPLMLHCNHGKHRTGCVVAVVRKVYGWETSNVLAEYKSYAEPKIRECDLDYISAFQISTLRLTMEDHSVHSPVHVRTFFRAILFSFVVLVLWLVSGAQMRPRVNEDHALK